jgi:formate C-acetyltransferase
MQGRDERGLTAVLNSLTRIPHHLAAGSSSAIIEIDPALFEPAYLDRMVDIVATAIERGVGQLQFNVVNAEALRRAQAEPDNHRNLCVRVSGFSQKFCLLDRQMQDHIIARTKHAQ